MNPDVPSGVTVGELSESGSAFAVQGAQRLVGSKISRVAGEDVGSLSFDEVMDKIIAAESPVSIDFEMTGSDDDDAAAAVEEEEVIEPEVSFTVGTNVVVTVMQEGKETVNIEAKVGDNLRKVLLANNVELYRGLKKKLGNCGGGGQCTFCAVDFVESEGWVERSDYENGKIGKWPSARLACMNNIQGPATIRVE